jgi:peptide deformylase
MKKIVQIGDSVLRKKAQEVPVSEITSPKIQKILNDMVSTLENAPDGAALAAPQIGVSLRIFILAKKVFGPDSNHEAMSKDRHFIYINPVIIKKSGKKQVMDEGCLSVHGRYGNIKRSTHVTIEAYDEFGKKFTRGAGGLLAQAFQHECDHLEGTLFVDDAIETWLVDMEEVQKENK